MKRMTAFFLLVFFFVFDPVLLHASGQNSLRLNDIQKVMDRFFALHITSKELTPVLVRRSVKIYIENFDVEKAYLLEKEAAPYLYLSDAQALEILGRLKKQDYSDFIALNQVIQKAVLRAENMRKTLIQSLILNDAELSSWPSSPLSSQFPQTESELLEKQKNRMVRFFMMHKMRSNLDTVDRKEKVFLLFEKKVRRQEYAYLFADIEGKGLLPKDRVEHLMAVRIVKSFAKSLDTHTSFFSPEEAYDMRLGLEKQFEGVGVILSEGIDGIMIAELIQGGPAARCGKIQINDFLVAIDHTPIQSMTFEEVMELLKKKGKEEIVLGLKRGNPQENYFQVSLRKQPIVMNEERIQTGVEKFENGIIGKIALHSFYENSDGASSERDLKEAIRSFRQQGNLLGLVLDLRENSGGFLSQAVRVAGLFVANGVVVISKYGQGETHYLRNVSGKSFFSGPLVVLTSKMSASAAEIVAQALQDYGVALVVGDTRTFGKGSIQYQTVTDPSADLFYKVTVGRYYTVSGKSTQINGVIADIVVPTQYAPYNIGEQFLEYPLSPDRVEAMYVDSLSDLDERTRKVFEARYTPFTQRVVTYWKKALPTLQKNSAERLANSPAFQALLQKQSEIKARQQGMPVNTIDEKLEIGLDDLQMEEAVNVVKDMLNMEAQQERPAAYFPLAS